MMPVFYMTAAGVWACSCQTEADKPDPTLIPAPEGGGEGLRWDGEAWVAYAPPPDACTALQGRRALGMDRVHQINQLVAHLDLLMPDLSEESIWEIQTAWALATTWDRLGREVNLLRELYGMTEPERDDFMRLAVTL